jgi:hypothetical protein
MSNFLTSPALVLRMDGVTALNDVVDLAAGDSQVCALRADETVWCWGAGFASNFGATNVVSLGSAWPTFVTSDGKYHAGNTKVAPKCGAL